MYGFVRGEISPFRLVRMTQKDMQAIKATETPEKQTSEVNVINLQNTNDGKNSAMSSFVCFSHFCASRLKMLLLLLRLK